VVHGSFSPVVGRCQSMNRSTLASELVSHSDTTGVHLWEASLDVPHEILRSLRTTLSEEESLRASRYRTDVLRNRFIASRGILRDVLAGYLQIPAAEIRFDLSTFGKPHIRPSQNTDELQFNLSHTESKLMVAITSKIEVGVDVERLRSDIDSLAIANRFFSPDEATALANLSGEERTAAFYRCWTRKEAYVKARGTGLANELKHFTVSVASAHEVHSSLISDDHDPAAPREWTLKDLPVETGYCAAVACRSRTVQLRQFTWSLPNPGS